MTKSYLLLGEEQQGPFSDEELRTMLAAGRITAKTPCWKEGMSDWQPLGSIEDELSEPVSTIAPPRRAHKPGSQRTPPSVITKEKVHEEYDLSARATPMMILRCVVGLALVLLLIIGATQLVSYLIPDPDKGLAKQLWEMEHK